MTPPMTIVKAVSGIKVPRAVPASFAYLMKQCPPRAIQNRRQYDNFQSLITVLMKQLATASNENTKRGIRMYLDLLVPLIEKYEGEHWSASNATPREVLAYLMAEHDLTQADLKDEIGSQPYVSEILGGKKSLTLDQVSKLAKRFHVSPSVFVAK